MIRAYGEKRKCYVIIEKTVSKEQALKMAAVELHESANKLEVSCATVDTETAEKIIFNVKRKSGDYWCMTRK